MRLALEKVIILILILIVIALLIFYGSKTIWPSAKSIAGWDIGGLDAKEAENLATQQFFNFIAEYKSCKESQDTQCRCQFTIFSLPPQYWIYIENRGGTTIFKLFKDPKDKVAFKEAKTEEDKKDFIISKDEIFFPIESPDYFIDEYGSFNTRGYSQLSSSQYVTKNIANLYLIENKPGFTEDVATPIKIGSPLNDKFSLQGLYKLDNTKTYFIPAPYSFWSANTEQCLLDAFNSLRICNAIDKNAKQVFDNLIKNIKLSIQNCKEESLLTVKKCGALIKISLPNEYIGIFSEKSIFFKKTDQNILQSYLESYPIEVKIDRWLTSNIRFIFTNNIWKWKANIGSFLDKQCSCRYYSLDFNDLDTNCNPQEGMNEFYKKIIKDLKSVESSYDKGIKVLFKIAASSESDGLEIIANTNKVYSQEKLFEYYQQEGGDAPVIEEIKQLALKSSAQLTNIIAKENLGYEFCELDAINPIKVSTTKQPVLTSSDKYIELAQMPDGKFCFYSYSEDEIKALALESLGNLLAIQNQNV